MEVSYQEEEESRKKVRAGIGSQSAVSAVFILPNGTYSV